MIRTLLLTGMLATVLVFGFGQDKLLEPYLPEPPRIQIPAPEPPPPPPVVDHPTPRAPTTRTTRPEGVGRPCRFFGVRANGLKIVYVVDRSGSMLRTFDFVRAEMVYSIRYLAPKQQFSVIFFAGSQPDVLSIEGKSRLTHATPLNKAAAKNWIVGRRDPESGAGIAGIGLALKAAFEIAGGPPNAIYLLTDGDLPPETLDLLRKLNADKKVRIHTIAFIDRAGEKKLKKIAEEDGGTYKFISEEELGEGL
ncbi:MAG: VWA domain-containing protein [Phycisphaerae bacterium]|nr:VWA domain-containing protein [Phycisphaerae bacterium]